MILKIIIINLICIFLSYSANSDNQGITILKIIDKVSGKSYIHEIYKDKVLNFRNVNISSTQCIVDEDNNKNYAAFINLKESNKDKYIFKGWILSKKISFSQVSHPVYSIKLIKCL